jgi:hypothetical protein
MLTRQVRQMLGRAPHLCRRHPRRHTLIDRNRQQLPGSKRGDRGGRTEAPTRSSPVGARQFEAESATALTARFGSCSPRACGFGGRGAVQRHENDVLVGRLAGAPAARPHLPANAPRVGFVSRGGRRHTRSSFCFAAAVSTASARALIHRSIPRRSRWLRSSGRGEKLRRGRGIRRARRGVKQRWAAVGMRG